MVSRSRLKSFLTGLALYAMASALIGYFWVFLGLTLKARELHESEQARAEVPAEAAPLRPQYAVPLSARGG